MVEMEGMGWEMGEIEMRLGRRRGMRERRKGEFCDEGEEGKGRE